MPKLPVVPLYNRRGARKITSDEEASCIAHYIAHMMPKNISIGATYQTFARRVRDFFDRHPDRRAEFIEWYEKQEPFD